MAPEEAVVGMQSPIIKNFHLGDVTGIGPFKSSKLELGVYEGSKLPPSPLAPNPVCTRELPGEIFKNTYLQDTRQNNESEFLGMFARH